LEAEAFPTMAEMKRAIIVAAYDRSNRKPLEAARLLGIGKTPDGAQLTRKARSWAVNHSGCSSGIQWPHSGATAPVTSVATSFMSSATIVAALVLPPIANTGDG
jgi:hypothetical protein